jgi:hypothetical protein
MAQGRTTRKGAPAASPPEGDVGTDTITVQGVGTTEPKAPTAEQLTQAGRPTRDRRFEADATSSWRSG